MGQGETSWILVWGKMVPQEPSLAVGSNPIQIVSVLSKMPLPFYSFFRRLALELPCLSLLELGRPLAWCGGTSRSISSVEISDVIPQWDAGCANLKDDAWFLSSHLLSMLKAERCEQRRTPEAGAAQAACRPAIVLQSSCKSRRFQPLLPRLLPAREGWYQVIMTEKTQEPHVEEDDDELDGKLNYKPPPQKTLQELQELDKDDESLAKYKKSLLGDGPVVADPTAPNVVVTRLTLVCDSAPGPITMDLTGDLEALKKETFVLKEGVEYRVKIHFKVNRDIVSGLKYVQHTYRTGVKVDKATFMVGSYGPRPEEYEFLTPIEEAPKGMLARGTYHNKSFFTDDDKHDHLTWEWNLSIKKEWTE
uniref:Rho GDP dissociation inhibitor beta n=1 Tax=Anas zonorhyncha TaxID=75864 RepID=A0A8B9VNW5_9AVES